MSAPAVTVAGPATAAAPLAGPTTARPSDIATAIYPAAAARSRSGGGWVRWVLDPDDDAACVRRVLELHDLGAGRIVCHPRPGATWPVLVADVFRSLGKHPDALARERRIRDAAGLLRIWLRAEQVSDLVMLRAHLLAPEVLGWLVDLAVASEVTLWLVWHRRDPPPGSHPERRWTEAVTALSAHDAPRRVPDPDEIYAAAFTAARTEARGWRPDGHRLGWKVPYSEHAWPGCDVGALLQRLTIDAETPAELRVRLCAAQAGFTAEGQHLALPDLDTPGLLSVLGPRLAPERIDRLRRLVCPTTAAAVMLGWATGAEPRFLAGCLLAEAGAGHVPLLAGNYRVPERAYPLLRAAILAHDLPTASQPLLARPGTRSVSPQRLAHLIGRGSTLASVDPPPAARPLYGINPATRFASDFTSHARVTALPQPLQF